MCGSMFNLTEIGTTQGYGNFSNSQIRIGHNATRYPNLNALPYVYRTFSLSLTWIGPNATHYHNFNELPHALPNSFSKFSMVWGLFETGYHALLPIF